MLLISIWFGFIPFQVFVVKAKKHIDRKNSYRNTEIGFLIVQVSSYIPLNEEGKSI